MLKLSAIGRILGLYHCPIQLYVKTVISLTPMNLHCCSFTNSHPVLCDSMDCSTPGFLSFPISQCLFKLKSIESVMPSNHLILCPILLLLLSIFPSIQVFSNESVLCIRCQSIGVSASASVLQ